MEQFTARLSILECPVNWNLEKTVSSKRIGSDSNPSLLAQLKEESKSYLREKIGCDAKYALRDGYAIWQKMSQFLSMAWLEYSTDSLDGMRKFLDDVDEFIADVEPDVELIPRYINAVKYLYNAMWSHLFYKENNATEVSAHLSLLPPFAELLEKDQAAIFALKSCVFMEFGPAGHEEAYRAINKAVELDEDQAEWHALKGKCLSRHRRAHDFRSVPTDEELSHLRKAVSLKAGSAAHYVFCGQSVMEYGMYSRCSSEEREAHMDECEELMTIAALLNDNSPIILTRIAKALIHMKGGRASDLLEHCVHRSYELLPGSGLVNHVAGNYYMYRKQEDKKAIFHLKKAALDCGVFGAFMNLLEMVWKTCTDTDVGPIIEQFWEKFGDNPIDRLKVLHVMASYRFFVKNDIVGALPYWKEWMIAGKSKDMSHIFVNCFDLTVPLVGEIKSQLTSNPKLSSDDEEIMRTFLSEVLEARPDVNTSTITMTREDVIKSTLNKMNKNPTAKRLVARKLKVKQLQSDRRVSSHPPSWRAEPAQRPEPARRAEPERILPTNWRER